VHGECYQRKADVGRREGLKPVAAPSNECKLPILHFDKTNEFIDKTTQEG
jgi:hypothetical protein